MTPGSLFFDPTFKFHDEDKGRKILVSIGRLNGVVIVAKATSNGRLYRNDYGCQAEHRFPCFHLPQGSCCLERPTWINLTDFYAFRDAELLQKRFSGGLYKFGELVDTVTKELLECALQSQFIEQRFADIVRAAAANFQ